MQPVWWSQRGSVPPLCRLLRAYLARAGAAAPVQGVLGVVQQRLIQSKINDLHGFDLLQALVAYAPFPAWSEYMRGILVTLLTRLQTAKTDTFVRGFVHWLLYVLAVGVEPGKRAAGLTPDWLVGSVNAIQGDLFDVLLGSFVVETVPQLGNGAGALVARERRAAIVGMARLLSESTYVAGKGATWVKALQATVQLYRKQPAAAPQGMPVYLSARLGADRFCRVAREHRVRRRRCHRDRHRRSECGVPGRLCSARVIREPARGPTFEHRARRRCFPSRGPFEGATAVARTGRPRPCKGFGVIARYQCGKEGDGPMRVMSVGSELGCILCSRSGSAQRRN